MTQVSDPKLSAVYTMDGFIPSFGPGTKVSSLDSDLSTPDSSKEFTMEFVFSKDMDKISVENPFNWQISRQQERTMEDHTTGGFRSPRLR
jgi:hypothetical protein